MNPFARRLLEWHARHGRQHLPWQQLRSPYRVWVSEVMLQQTRVQAVIGYFERFMARFPDLATLAAATEDEVLALWSGLGYYQRGRHLLRAARLCMERHGGELPDRLEPLAALPGIGRSTAAAILALAHGQRQAILDGNVRRLLSRLVGEPAWPGQAQVQRRLWAEAEARLPEQRLADYTQALMDFGALCCTPRQPQCPGCPFAADCVARRQDAVGRIPAPRPTRPLPTRSARLRVLRDAEGRVLLERREGKGVWQGLWSLPEIESGEPEPQGAGGLALPAFTHAFSHYRLELQPILHTVAETTPTSPGQRWVSIEQLDTIGLPRPIRNLLERLP